MTETFSQKAGKDLENILNELSEESIAQMSFEELTELRKAMNPYGRTISGSDKFLTFSFTNLTQKYVEKLVTTAMIGFLNRMCDEWHVPDGIPVVPVYDYVKDPSLIDQFGESVTKTEEITKAIEENKHWMAKRVIVKEFLEEMFQFNPDTHVRSAYKPQPKDLSRDVIDTPAANLAIKMFKDIKFRNSMIEFDRVQKLIQMKESKGTSVDKEIETLVAKKLVLPEYHYYTMDFSKWSDEDRNLLNVVCNMIPPDDTFHRLRYYMESNYDKLREAVQYLYCDKPDLDMALNPYDWHSSLEEAEEFQKKHRNELITDVFIGHSGKWNFFAPFKNVRESMKYFNDNTIVLEEIASQIEKDAKLGQDLMQKRIKIKKEKNIAEAGDDSELFKQWKKENPILKEFGLNEQQNKDSYADDEIPDDAIQVDVFRISNGGLKLEKDKFFTKAEGVPTIERK